MGEMLNLIQETEKGGNSTTEYKYNVSEWKNKIGVRKINSY